MTNKKEYDVFKTSLKISDYLLILKGKSTIARLLQNYHISTPLSQLQGKVLEIGATSYRSCYKNLAVNSSEYIQSNFEPDNSNILYLDATNMDVIENNSIDGIVCLNVLEHILDYNKALDEFFRVLKPNGTLIISAPFLFGYHGAPSDFCRFTHSFYSQRLKDYSELEIVQIGNKYATIANCLQGPKWGDKGMKNNNIFMRLLAMIFCIISTFTTKKDEYALFYTIIAKK